MILIYQPQPEHHPTKRNNQGNLGGSNSLPAKTSHG